MVNVVELFSGIGGMHYSLKGADINYNVVAAVDINTSANELYKHNFPKTQVHQRNIQSFSCDEFNKFNANLITMSPPCQPFTRVGLKKDDSDERTNALMHIIELWPKLNSNVKYLILENVQGFENSNSRDALVKALVKCDFTFQEFLLNPTEYLIPCSRLRYYLIAKRKPLQFTFQCGELMKSIPMHEERLQGMLLEKIAISRDSVGDSGNHPYTISSILETDTDTSKYSVPMTLLRKYSKVYDLVFPFSRRCCCFTKAYGRYAEGTGSVLCPMPLENDAKALLENMDLLYKANVNNKDNVNEELAKILKRTGVRYFTPREIARLLCFPEEFTWPEHYNSKQLYKLLGNSINVLMVTLLATLLFDEER
ncbi:tRNA (cytosine(38)-C(5))-methyltransferase [Hetaerina americana]|uniref:tRNA (cytosine(38)-C(5))-methyltransferase n=1 Tax=Hetaerina americana TaxID=62018 RepID=UPI003A7F2E28